MASCESEPGERTKFDVLAPTPPEPPRDAVDQLARQHRQHLLWCLLDETQQRDHTPLRIVVAREQALLRTEPGEVARDLPLQERDRVLTAYAQHAERIELN